MGLSRLFRYESASLTGTGTLSATGQCFGIRIFANAVDSSFKLSGTNLPLGATITLRSGTGVDINMPDETTILDPTVTWISGSLDIIIGVFA